MNYYKIIKDQTFIGVISSNNFRKYNKRHQFLGPATENDGELVDYMGQYYRDTWMTGIAQAIPYSYIAANIISISELEYESLNIRLEENQEQTIEDETILLQEPIVNEEIQEVNVFDTLTVDEMKRLKLQQLSAYCHNTIENGFDLELRNEIHHFSLDTQDQLNLISLHAMAQTQTLIPYHADNEACIFYTNEEINEIVETATAFKIYHTTYYNALKGYVNSLDNIADIAAIRYGIEIPEAYKSDVLRTLEQ